ncbi:MAG: ferrous iron transport protein, partial [Planctomycetota bacterium]
TLFSALCGVHQQTGNYPGVTVERKEGRFEHRGQSLLLLDLPGTYSLAPRSPDEMIAVDVLLGRQAGVETPDAVLCIVDASNLERNLYLVSQVLEMGLPTVLALNMMDVAQSRGIRIDASTLSTRLGIPVIPVEAHRRRGLEELKQALIAAWPEATEASGAITSDSNRGGTRQEQTGLEPAGQEPAGQDQAGRSQTERASGAKKVATKTRSPRIPLEAIFPAAVSREVRGVCELLQSAGGEAFPEYLALRLLFDSTGYLENGGLAGVDLKLKSALQESRSRLAEAGTPVPGIEAISRYQWIGRVLVGIVERPQVRTVTWSDRIDRVLTHRVAGTLIFLVLMALLFQLVFVVAEPLKEWIEAAQGAMSSWIESAISEGPLRSLAIHGIVEGVGGVVVFLPQICALFFCIAILEDCGYMARAAYLMDRLMSRVGLNGKSFIPLLSSFACAIPGIMSTRVIENPRDRLVTMLVAPLMSCSARVPVYFLLVSTFIPDRHWYGFISLRGLVLMASYSVGALVAIAVAMVLKKTILRGETPPFVMELPGYKFPQPRLVLHRMIERGWAFLYRAGTLILAVSVLVWAMAYFPHRESDLPDSLRTQRNELRQAIETQAETAEATGLSEQLADVEHQIEGEYLRRSFLGRLGKWVEPAVKPLGWDWRIGCAVIASFPAREVVVATLGVIYNLGSEADAESDSLHTALQQATWEGSDRPVFTIPVALSLLVFFALCAQCSSTLVVLRRETNSWKWPLFTFVYMTTLAYLGAWVVYQLGSRWS